MLDIREGDFLVVGTKEYPIKAVLDFAKSEFNTPSFAKLCTVTASTKRPPTVNASTGLRSTSSTNLSNLKCMPLDPASNEIMVRYGTGAPTELLTTFIADAAGFVELILEDLKT